MRKYFTQQIGSGGGQETRGTDDVLVIVMRHYVDGIVAVELVILERVFTPQLPSQFFDKYPVPIARNAGHDFRR